MDTQPKRRLQVMLENGRHLQLQMISAHTFRFRFNGSGSFVEPAPIRYGILRIPESADPFTAERSDNHLSVRSEQALLQVDLKDGRFSLSSTVNELVHAAAPPRSSDDGFALELALHDADKLYGLGNIHPERLERRGLKADIWTAANLPADTPIPYLMSSRGWALLMNTTYRHTFDIGCAVGDRLHITGTEGELDFLLFVGNDLGQLLDRYTIIAGKPPLLPMWAYGLNYSCRDMDNARGVLDDALRFRQTGMPCDLIGLSYGWLDTDKSDSMDMSWHPGRFPLSAGGIYREVSFIGVLERHGFKLSVLLHCRHDLTAEEERRASGDKSVEEGDKGEGRQESEQRESEQREEEEGENKARGPSGASWYSKLRSLVDDGVDAFLVQVPFPFLGGAQFRATGGMREAELHNLYPVLAGKQLHHGFRKQTGRRPMIHMVAGHTGMQQYVASTSGRYQDGTEAVASLLNYGLSGHVHTSTNMNPITREGIHYGFLLTWARINSQQHFRHPSWLDHALRNLFQKYAKLRYRLLPYLYTAAHHAARTGMPVTRAMPLAFPADPDCAELKTQYMLGDSLLVVVCTTRVYLPAGLWIDYWTGSRHQGPASLECRIPEEAGGLLFVRGGAILPMRPEADYIGPDTPRTMTIHLYPDGISEYTLLEDDGVTYGYKEGQIAETRMRCEADAGRITVRIARRSGTYAGMPDERSYEVVLHIGQKPAVVRVDGEELSERKRRQAGTDSSGEWRFDRKSGTVSLYAKEPPTDREPLCIEAVVTAKGGGSARRARAGDTFAAPASGDALEGALDAALDTLDARALEAALTSWWTEGANRPDRGAAWRLLLMKGGTLLIGLAERRGWNAQQVFGQEMDNLFALRDIAVPEQGSALLRRLAEQLLRHASRVGPPPHHPVIREAMAVIERDIAAELSLRELAGLLAVHPFHLSRLFRKITGRTLTEHKLNIRMRKARMMLEAGAKVYEAAAAVGYKDTANFSKAFSSYWGVPPKYFKPRSPD